MTKAELIAEISENTGISKAEVRIIVEAFMVEVMDALLSNEYVQLKKFGTFQIKKRAETLGRNIRKNTPLIVPAHCIPYFKPAQLFLKRMREKNPL